MDIRKTLIDFLKYYNDYWKLDTEDGEEEAFTDKYLKSINGGSIETQADRQNEQIKEVKYCQDGCGNTVLDDDLNRFIEDNLDKLKSLPKIEYEPEGDWGDLCF